MRLLPQGKGEEVDVLFRVVREPSRAVIKVSLTRETGDDGKQYWRILQVGFSDPRPPRTTAPASAPATTQAATSR